MADGTPGDSSKPVEAALAGSRALATELRGAIRGEVRFDDGSRALYSTDASNYRQIPIGVVIPRDAADVETAIAICRRHGAPVLPRGGGTSLAGQCCNVAVVLDFSKYLDAVLDIDPARRLARVQPGVVLDDLRDAAERHGLTFGPDPATHNRCTLGGMLGNDSCGVHSVMSGKTVDNTEALDILTYDGARLRVGATSEEELARLIGEGGRRGAIYAGLRDLRDRYGDLVRARFPKIPRRVSGYNLDQLLPENGFQVARALVGTEGTCVTILEATLKLVHSPASRTLVALGYPDIFAAADDVPTIMAHGPIGLEGMDSRIVADMRAKGLHSSAVALLPPGNGWLLVEFGADDRDEANERARRLIESLRRTANPPAMKMVERAADRNGMWAARESAVGATARVPGQKPTWPGWEDSAVPPERMGRYLRDLRALMDRFGYTGAFYGHFGQGCLHVRVDFDLQTPTGIAAFTAFTDQAADLVIAYGGSLSGEHGDGQARADLLPKLYGPELLEAFRQFKALWDPDGRMNPGKVVTPHPRDANLRLGTRYNPARPATHFAFAEDGGSLADATLRCVGVGKCRRHEAGTMCPSYMATREEAHSTRGRARLLFEMLQGEVITDGWRSEAVKESLDLCLACKACRGECPVNVDMATYKAEFLSHYYQGRLRPLTAYSMGLIHRWARVAALAPWLANAFTQTPLLRDVAKRAAGIAPARRVPAFAPTTFTRWFRRRDPRATGNTPGRRVILWPDTFNNHFHPQTAIAAVEVLEAAGCEVVVPQGNLCCGRPLYDFGMLNTAKRLLRRILDTLRDEIAAGTPLVVLEPSCAAVFRDELPNLFPRDEAAKHLAARTFLLSEFLNRQAPGYAPPRLAARALIQGHCHHKALMTMTDELAVLNAMGVAYDAPDAGCCGMAGAFGFERAHYDVSLQVGERVLLPAVRAASPETLIIADGFSCREQIAQATDRRALHLADVLALALRAESATADPYPERAAERTSHLKRPAWAKSATLWITLTLAIISSAMAWRIHWRRRGRRRDR